MPKTFLVNINKFQCARRATAASSAFVVRFKARFHRPIWNLSFLHLLHWALYMGVGNSPKPDVNDMDAKTEWTNVFAALRYCSVTAQHEQLMRM